MDIEHIDTVTTRGNGLSLHKYLHGCWPFLNSECSQQLLTDLSLEIDGNSLAALGEHNPTLNEGQTLQYILRDYSEDPVDTDWKLLWNGEWNGKWGGEQNGEWGREQNGERKGGQDAGLDEKQNEERQATDIIAIHKPANLPVSRTTRNFYNTLIRLVRRQSDWPDAHLLHRLDLDTSGIILLGKNKAAASFWQPKLQQLLVRKVYQAVVYGQPDWDQLEFECKLATRQGSAIRCQMHVCDEQEKGKLSRTGFKVLTTTGDYSIIECELFTGRKHQIRAHLAHLGHPIVGDKIYSNNGDFYLKRLNDTDTAADHEKLQTEHHLLFAQMVVLNLSKDEHQKETHVIHNRYFPPAWLKFCAKIGLCNPEQ